MDYIFIQNTIKAKSLLTNSMITLLSVCISECILLVNLLIQGMEINLLHFNNSKLCSNSASFVNVEHPVN